MGQEGLAWLAIAYVTAGSLSIVPDILSGTWPELPWMMGELRCFHVPITEENGFCRY
ncbi:MAG: hypothetical protein R2857_03610 [Vampirovibrionales bacterium]